MTTAKGKTVQYLSSGLGTLSDSERAEASQLAHDIECVILAENTAEEDGEKLAMLSEMFLAKPSAAVSELNAAARGRSFMVALDDIPSWAVAEAIRLWYRGEARGFTTDDFKWAPDSSVLRKVACDIMQTYRDRAAAIRCVLEARPLEEVL